MYILHDTSHVYKLLGSQHDTYHASQKVVDPNQALKEKIEKKEVAP